MIFLKRLIIGLNLTALLYSNNSLAFVVYIFYFIIFNGNKEKEYVI